MRSGEALGGIGCAGTVFEELKRGLGQLGEIGLDGLGPAELSEYIRLLRAHVDQAELLTSRALAAFERVEGHAGTGASDAIDFLGRDCKMSPESALDRVILSRQLDALPSIVELLSEGKLSFEQAAVMSRNTAKMRPEDVATVEARLLETGAAAMNAGRLRQHAAAVVAEVDGEVLRRDSARARERREVKIGPVIDGLANISGHLTSEAAVYLRAGLQPYLCPAGSEDTRTAVQRRHDALMQLAKRSVLDGGSGGNAKQPGGSAEAPGGGGTGNARRPQLVVVAPLSAMLGKDGPPPLLQGLVPISQKELDLLVCEADLSVVLRDAAGNIAFGGKRARTFSPAKRRSMLATNPTCAFDGCNLPAVDANMHHVDEYADGGLTTVDTGGPSCWVHHSMIHMEGWALVANGDGTFRTLAPGDPDNPKSKESVDEYIRHRREAIFKRKAARLQKSRRRRRSTTAPPSGGRTLTD
ncbi:MAG: HNH endonuclease [Candidatus Dormibacteraeota bacterium]|nr:HNH endonuclease [Candidatus Dormibacteraeota bacterium]